MPKHECPDDHDVMKPVPNRADRRRMKKRKSSPTVSHVENDPAVTTLNGEDTER